MRERDELVSPKIVWEQPDSKLLREVRTTEEGSKREVECAFVIRGSKEESILYFYLLELALRKLNSDGVLPMARVDRVPEVLSSGSGVTVTREPGTVSAIVFSRVSLESKKDKIPLNESLIYFLRTEHANEAQFGVALRLLIEKANELLKDTGKEAVPPFPG